MYIFVSILFFTLRTMKAEGVLRGIKTLPRPQEFYRTWTGPPGFEISGSATAQHVWIVIFCSDMGYYTQASEFLSINSLIHVCKWWYLPSLYKYYYIKYQFSKVDIKENNISTVILLIKFLFYQWDPRHLHGSRVVYIIVYIMKFMLYLISNHIFVCINHKDTF